MVDTNLNNYETNLPVFYDTEINITFNFIYANIRSLRRNFNNFLVELNSIKSKIHCIVLSEIWIKDDEVNLYKIPGFNSFARCNDTYRAGGVICYVNEEANVSQINIEMITADVMVLKVKIKNTFFNVFSIYRLLMYSEITFYK